MQVDLWIRSQNQAGDCCRDTQDSNSLFRFSKRALDWFLAVLVLVLLADLIAVFGLWLKSKARGPVSLSKSGSELMAKCLVVSSFVQ